MKSFAVVASLAACAFAQRLSILAPTNQTTVTGGSTFIAELHQDVRLHFNHTSNKDQYSRPTGSS
jgi:hypothetical protein